jgi:hypothetical protein
MHLGGSNKSSLALAVLILSLAVRGRVVFILFPLVPRASDNGWHSFRCLPGQAQT